jgi:hypothetical protein
VLGDKLRRMMVQPYTALIVFFAQETYGSEAESDGSRGLKTLCLLQCPSGLKRTDHGAVLHAALSGMNLFLVIGVGCVVWLIARAVFLAPLIPRHCIMVLDAKNQVVELRLYEHKQDAYRAGASWLATEDGFVWHPSNDERTVHYWQSDLRISLDYLLFNTLSVSDEQLRQLAADKHHHYEALHAARAYESGALSDPAFRSAYYWKKYRFLLRALLPVIAVSAILYYVKRNYVFDPLPYFSLLVAVAGFLVVAYFLYKETGSWITAILAAVGAWIVWGLLFAAFVVDPPLFAG